MGIKNQKKKITLAKKGRQTKWAPVGIVLKKFGVGIRIHHSAIPTRRRSWRRNKVHIKPRRQQKSHFG